MGQPIKQRKIPLRKCVVTNEQHPKMEMFRIVRDPEGNIIVDDTGKVRGHGAYICKKKTAILTAQKKKTLERHLETTVPDTVYEQLLARLDNGDK